MSKCLLIMAAGTGGHIFPGLAIAETLAARGWQVSWLGTRHGMEQTLVPKKGITLDAIEFAGLRGRGLMQALKGVWQLIAGCCRSLKIVRQRRPDLVLGMGGYVTVPGGVAARLAGVPLVLVNADAQLLLSNRLLKPLARKTLFGLPAGGRADATTVVTGNPVRAEIAHLPLPAQRFAGRTGSLRILVVGGSLGAKVLNDCVPAALALLSLENRPQVVHQSGKKHLAALQANYAKAGVKAELLDFIDDMAARYAEVDLVICRAGAITVSELTAAGVASMLVPFLVKTTSHQRENAVWMAGQKAAIHLPQNEMTPQKLADVLGELTRAQCLAMAEAAYACGRRAANEEIAAVLESCAAQQKENT